MFMLLVLLVPLIVAIGYTFFKIDFMRGSFEFVGLRNYIRAFSNPVVISSTLRTFVFSVFSVSATFVIATGVALMLNEDFIGNLLCGALILIP